PRGSSVPVLTNLFGTRERVAAAIGAESTAVFPELGKLLAALRTPSPPRGLGDAWRNLPLIKEVLKMAPRTARSAPCHEVLPEGGDVDLGAWPIQTCWPQDAGPLITWGLTITRGAPEDRQNVGIYRQQVIGRN